MNGNNIIIVNSQTGREYYLDEDEILAFNDAYGIALEQSTAEYLVNKFIDNQIEGLEGDFYSQKELLLEQAEEIAAVTAIAQEIESAKEARKISLNEYAVENSLTGIEDDTVQMFNATIDDMVSTSRTVNMLELYRGAIVESVSFIAQATQTAQAFFDDAQTVADSYGDNLNIEWEGQTISVEGEFWEAAGEQNFYGDDNAPTFLGDEISEG